MTILITGATSAKAYRLKKQFETDNLLLGDYLELPPSMVNSGKLIQLPSPLKSSYAHEMLTLCLDKGIEQVIVLNGNEMEALKPVEQLFAEYNIIIKEINDKL